MECENIYLTLNKSSKHVGVFSYSENSTSTQLAMHT